ncbi:MAG: polymerase sigma-70 factor, sigma-E family [Frankiales bacterium]|jgi:RNA polymerase sigma-70 factor (sigma-E family)|nr:polymerase sigma-70 factor, sigma-E family [Frankiales bacterium]
MVASGNPAVTAAVPSVVSIDDFEVFVRARSTPLLRTAYLMVGDYGRAEDLLQDVLTKVARNWHRIDGPPEAYVRRALLNAAVNGWRRRRVAEVPWSGQDVAGPDPFAALDLRQSLMQGLRSLPPRQRAVLVCRYFDDLSEADTAALLGISTGTVKSTTSRALERLRQLTTHLDRSPS